MARRVVPPVVISHLDHLVLTVRDLEATCGFYQRALGLRRESFAAGRTALHFGRQKINLHPAGGEFDPKSERPTPGSADLCFIAETPIAEIAAHLTACGIAIEEGPVARSGAEGPIVSLYLRDPDGNLIEVSNPYAR